MNTDHDLCLIADRLNRECACLTVDHAALQAALTAGGLDVEAVLAERPHLFSDTMVYVGAECLARMAALIAAMEQIVALPAYRQRVLQRAPDIARHPTAARGAFLGYDFHLGPEGPRLIEINTNAGGGLLNALLLRAQRACARACGAPPLVAVSGDAAEARFLGMFTEEWRLVRGAEPLRRIAIVDEAPESQFLAPEFELFRQLFIAAGIDACVVDPRELKWDGQHLLHDGQIVDLVYNRLTDFTLETSAVQPMRAAWLADAVVLTPHPQAHALYADKRNLALLSDPQALSELGVSPEIREILLAIVPPTVEVTAVDGERFWQERKQWFFKPAAGFGSRAAYRGDKLTRRVFEEIMQGGYIAQQVVPPSERRVAHVEGERDLKLDLRCYAYAGKVQLAAARLYQGQTTNFRTAGGGFAAVMSFSG